MQSEKSIIFSMRTLNETRLSRRNFIAAVGGAISLASFGYGCYRALGPETALNNQAIAALPPLSSTEQEIKEARALITQGEKYLESLENPSIADKIVAVDLQSPEFATAEAVVYEANVRKKEIDDINNTGGKSALLLVGGALGFAVSGLSIDRHRNASKA